jgi:disulfide bond formation protein DsbB
MEKFFITTLSLGSLFLTALIISFLLSLFTKQKTAYAKILKKHGLVSIFVLSLIATIGSLLMDYYFNFPPCDLCWYQRMFMYPVVFISGYALLKGDKKEGATYTILLSFVGMFIALYHYILQISDTLKANSAFCSPLGGGDCSIPDFVEFGFVTTPFISSVAFIFIIICAYYVRKQN